MDNGFNTSIDGNFCPGLSGSQTNFQSRPSSNPGTQASKFRPKFNFFDFSMAARENSGVYPSTPGIRPLHNVNSIYPNSTNDMSPYANLTNPEDCLKVLPEPVSVSNDRAAANADFTPTCGGFLPSRGLCFFPSNISAPAKFRNPEDYWGRNSSDNQSARNGNFTSVSAGSPANFVRPFRILSASLDENKPVPDQKDDPAMRSNEPLCCDWNSRDEDDFYTPELLNELRLARIAMTIEPPPEEEDKDAPSCNCTKSQCVKLYCECFSSGYKCGESCKCINCSNIEDEDIAEARKIALARNPLAFAPKVVTKDNLENGATTTQASARHKQGCNCKKSKCSKKYCACLEAGVGCSAECQCEDCENTYGQRPKDQQTVKKGKKRNNPFSATPIDQIPEKRRCDEMPCNGEYSTSFSSTFPSSFPSSFKLECEMKNQASQELLGFDKDTQHPWDIEPIDSPLGHDIIPSPSAPSEAVQDIEPTAKSTFFLDNMAVSWDEIYNFA